MTKTLEQSVVEQENDLVQLIQSPSSDVDILTWASAQKEAIKSLFNESPALLFRGFKCASLTDFCRIFSEPLDYLYRSTPRTEINKGMYTATEYPSDAEIPSHCENAYQNSWPLKLYFFCEKAADEGGETPLSDIRKVTAEIPLEIRDIFERKKVMYVRNYTAGLDLSWQTVFQTNDKSALEKYCNENDIEFEWTGPDSLRTRQICQGLAFHPVTKEKLWFNQAHLFHVSSLEKAIRDYLLQNYSTENLPRNAFYGNGDTIEDDVLDVVRAAFVNHKYSFRWQNNDLLFIDNMLCSHGRNPYKGARKVYVSMSDPVSNKVMDSIEQKDSELVS